jgi:legumain
MVRLLSLLALALAAASPVVEETWPPPWWPFGHDHWAVLVAGSSGYGNYRHQADVCHAYQLIKKAGVHPSQIIVLAVDDIANDEENPYPGKLFNKPTLAGTPGVDVYEGCKIDYSGKSVTPDTFVKVLTGDAAGLAGVEGSGKVLKSTHKSRVFVNFVDHGGVGIIGFPETTMHAKDLIGALTTMHTSKMYKELVFYLEACESGSMFETLPEGINIYATSAANAKESSWGTYCPPQDMINGKSINSCLGDLYSVNWMEDSDSSISSGETLAEQFTRVQKATNKSHVMQFGTQSIANNEPTSNFQGKTDKTDEDTVTAASEARLLGKPVARASALPPRHSSDLPSADAELASAYARFMATDSPRAAEELMKGMRDRLTANERFDKIAKAVTGAKLTGARPERVPMDCHYEAHTAYIAHCGEWTVGALKHSADLAHMCGIMSGDSRSIVAAIREVCAA